mmetsp:Transcript_11407/g.35455  ORF Transcript_11407/g.35455 Transcript_11407/m.35455 type:complete len:90 (-) Transcript_11407:16-285(-)
MTVGSGRCRKVEPASVRWGECSTAGGTFTEMATVAEGAVALQLETTHHDHITATVATTATLVAPMVTPLRPLRLRDVPGKATMFFPMLQ